MTKLNTTMDIFKLLDKSNCKKCNKPTCLAFAAAVFNGQKELHECPHLAPEIIDTYGTAAAAQVSPEQEREQTLKRLREKIMKVDFPSAAKRLGVPLSGNKLVINCLGKDFRVDTEGNVTTDIHVHPWILIPVLNYIIDGSGLPPTGKWVPLRELAGGKTWHRLFGQRCEKPLKLLADTYTDLFEDMIHLFNGKQVEQHYRADISLVLHPLPKVPILICYWKPDGELASNLNLFFDETAEENLNIESIYSMSVGLVIMFEKISLRHGLS